MNPLTVVVFDAGGHLKALKREDGSGILRVEVASGKAYGALGMGLSSRKLRDNLVDARPTFVNALAAAAGGRFIAVPGGVLIKDDGGEKKQIVEEISRVVANAGAMTGAED